MAEKNNCKLLSTCGFHSSPEHGKLSEDIDEDLSLTELEENLQNCGYTIPGKSLYPKIDEDLATNSEASIADIVSNVLNLSIQGSNDEEDCECENKAVSASNDLRCILLFPMQQMNI